jgi:hypothetical protein
MDIFPEDWREFLRWLYRHDRQSQWFPRIHDVGFVGKRVAANESEDEMNGDDGEERRTRRRVQGVDIHD